MTKLSGKQAKFVKEYLVDLNATQAAVRAGYSKKTAKVIGCENLTKPYIAAEVAKGQERVDAKRELSVQYVVNRLMDNVERAMQAERVMDSHGHPTGEYIYQGGVANGALGLLGKHLGMFIEKVEHSGSVDLSQTEREQAVLGILTVARKRQKELVS